MKINSPIRISTGVLGLDQILHGGVIPERSYLIRGGPGSGKTTLGLHFLTEGIANNEKVLFISLAESTDNLREDAVNRGFDLEGMKFLDLSPSSEFVQEGQDYNIFPSSQVDQGPLINKIIEEIKKIKPKRIFLDSLAQIRYLSSETFQFRKQVLSFIKFAIKQGATMFFSSEINQNIPDDDLQFISDGVINLEHSQEQRFINVTKFRGSNFYSGSHSIILNDKGMKVFPKLKPKSYRQKYETETISFGVSEINQLLHGGLERGTNTIISGPSGVGKTTLGIEFMKEAASRGEYSVVYTFEEGKETLIERCESINIPIKDMVNKGELSIRKIDPLDYTPDQFAHLVRKEVEEKEVSVVMIDSISGYCLSFQDLSARNNKIVKHLHALSEYLTNMGVTVLLINEVESITGDFRATDYGISYMADSIIFLRYLEMQGEMHKAIGVLKKRLSDFEKNLREMKITSHGIEVGKPLNKLHGILTGNPEIIEAINDENEL